jgi:hypothetical protein
VRAVTGTIINFNHFNYNCTGIVQCIYSLFTMKTM